MKVGNILVTYKTHIDYIEGYVHDYEGMCAV